LLLTLGLCAGAFSCASTESDIPETEAQADAVESAIAHESFPPTIEETYPFVRFTDFGEGRFRALVPVALASGAIIQPILQDNCPSLMRTDAPATIDVQAGYSIEGDPSAPPWASTASMKPVEDLLVLTGSRSDLGEILDFVDFFFNSSPQIEIQAQIIEVTDTQAFERGVSGLDLENLSGEDLLGGGTDGLSPDERSDSYDGNLGGPFFRGFDGEFAPSTSGAVFDLALIRNNYALTAMLQFVESSNAADIVSRPRAVTRNGRNAYLKSVENLPFQELKSLNAGISNYGIAYKEVGMTLQVMPVIVGSDTIHLTFQGNISKVSRQVGIGDEVIPVIASRDVKTEVSVRSGQSVVIGGLNMLETRVVKRGIPVLGDIPILGWLFSSKSDETVKTEVLFILTPVIKTRAASISRFGDIFDPWEEE